MAGQGGKAHKAFENAREIVAGEREVLVSSLPARPLAVWRVTFASPHGDGLRITA
jgi:hypothetical protein